MVRPESRASTSRVSASRASTSRASTSRAPALDEETPSLDPAAIEQAYLRERARRRARVAHREYARSSNARFWVVLAVLFVLTVVIALFAFHEIQTMFGI